MGEKESSSLQLKTLFQNHTIPFVEWCQIMSEITFKSTNKKLASEQVADNI